MSIRRQRQMGIRDSAVAGTEEQGNETLDLIILWWLCLVLPMAWAKGVFTGSTHRWIGALYTVRLTCDAPEQLRDILGDTSTYVTVEVPKDFVDKMITDLSLIFTDKALTEVTVHRLLGRAGRLAYLFPNVKPYVGMLWSAKAAADRHHDEQQARGSTGR